MASARKSIPVDDTSDVPPQAREAREWAEQGDGSQARLTAKVRKEITSLDELLDFFEVDRDEWEVERWLCNQWQMGAKTEDGVEITPLYQVKAWFRRRKDFLRDKADVDALVESARKVLRKGPKLPAVQRSRKKKPFLFVPAIMDPHFGKLCWGRETGWENYDVDEARRLVLAAVADLIEQAQRYPVAQVLFPLGNDYFHVDTGKNQTTAGTPQDVDGRWFRAYRKGREVAMEAIAAFREVAPVRVMIIPGNHDAERSLTLGDALSVAFATQSGIEVDTEPTLRKYHLHGRQLLGFEHGILKLNRLMGIMQMEAREMWGQARYAEWLRGHLHKKTEVTYVPVDEEHGIRVRGISSLTSPDYWHSSAGYVGSIRAAEGLLYHEELGYRGQFSYTPEMA